MRRAAKLASALALATAATMAVAQGAALVTASAEDAGGGAAAAVESAVGVRIGAGAGSGAVFSFVDPVGGAEIWALSADVDVRLDLVGPDGVVLANDDHGRIDAAFPGARPTDAAVVLPLDARGAWRVLVWNDGPRGGGAALVARGVGEFTFEGNPDRTPTVARGVDVASGARGGGFARPDLVAPGLAHEAPRPSATPPLGAARRVVVGTVDDFSALGSAGGPAPDPLPELRPWAPPAPSRRGVVDRRKLLAALANTSGEGGPTLGAAADFLQRSLAEAGYHELGFLGVPGGFAIVTQIEQIDAAGAPLRGAERYDQAIHWEPIPVWRVWDLFGALFDSPRGVYRVISLIVSDADLGPGEAAGAETFEGWVREGRVSLPLALRARPYGPRHDVVIHVYEFSKVEHDGPVRFEKRSPLGVDSHLRHTKLAELL